MKRIIPLLLILLTCNQILNSQTIETQGKAIAEIFTDFHYYLNDTSQTTGFGIKRAYLGYNFTPEGNFSSSIIVNIGSPEDLSEGSLSRRYGFFREASITYSKDKLDISFGITSTRTFGFQQRFWGKRYIAMEYQARNGYGSVADLGVVVDYKINNIIKFDYGLLNGKGYSNIQYDNHLKSTFGLTITPVKYLYVRLYSDIMKQKDMWKTTLIGFAGFKNDIICFGAEASYQSNNDLIKDHDVWGFSATGSVVIANKTEFFIRYDYSSSFIAPGDIIQWNYSKDTSFALSGFQYTFNKNVRIALNYQGTYPFHPGKQPTDAVFLNAHFRF